MKSKNSSNSTARNNQRAKKTLFLEIIITLVLIAVGITLCISWKSLIYKAIYRTVELKPNSEGFSSWLTPPTTITRGYYLFNISNPKDIVQDPSKTTVQLKETRGYHYVLSATKKEVQWSNDNEALSYAIYRIFTRNPKKFEPSSVDDKGVFVDILRATIRTKFEKKASAPFFLIGGNNPFYYRNAIEQLEGFDSGLFNQVKDKLTGPNKKKYGFIYRYNGSRSYNYTIKAGLMEKGQVLAFASENIPHSFSTPTPYPFPLYDGLTFVPMMFDKPIMNIFQADFCRPISAKFNKVIRMFGGIDVHEYVIKFVNYDNCENSSDPSTCEEVDKIDISHCISTSLPNETVFLSKPHFYGSSNETWEDLNTEGFTPRREDHEALIYFDPYSGTPLRAHHRIQLNIDAWIDPMKVTDKNDDDSSEETYHWTGRRATRRLLPLVWIDQEVNVDEATIRKIRLVHLALRHGQWIIIVSMLLIALIVVVIMEIIARRVLKKRHLDRRGHGPDAEYELVGIS